MRHTEVQGEKILQRYKKPLRNQHGLSIQGHQCLKKRQRDCVQRKSLGNCFMHIQYEKQLQIEMYLDLKWILRQRLAKN